MGGTKVSRQFTSQITDNAVSGRYAQVTPAQELLTSSIVRLVGTNFDGTNKDTNFWVETTANGGTVTQSGGEIELDTNTTANGSAKYQSARTARFVVGSALQWQAVAKFVTAGTANNVRRIGAYSTTDGFFFQLSGTTFSIGYRKGSSDTLVSNGSFNGTLGATIDTGDLLGYIKYSIEWTPKGIFFYLDNELLHKDGAGHRSNFLSLPITIENTNSGGATADVLLDVLATATVRKGELLTNSTFKYISSNATTICKYGPGTLHSIINNDNAGTVNAYDGITASGTQIAGLDTAKVLGSIVFDCPFNDGLTIVTGGGAKITVVYE